MIYYLRWQRVVVFLITPPSLLCADSPWFLPKKIDIVPSFRSPFASLRALTGGEPVLSYLNVLLPLTNGETSWWLATEKYKCDNSGSMRRFLLRFFFLLFISSLTCAAKQTLRIDRGAASTWEETY